MKNLPFQVFIIIIAANLALCANAASLKTITLKDGSVIRGEVTQLADSVYTIRTSDLGTLQIPEANVVSIVVEGAAAPSTTAPAAAPAAADTQALKAQTQQMQATLLSDPDIMQEIQGIMQDEEIRGALSDPEFMNAIFSYSPEKIQQSERTQYLLRNPKFQSLLEKIRQKMPAQ